MIIAKTRRTAEPTVLSPRLYPSKGVLGYGYTFLFTKWGRDMRSLMRASNTPPEMCKHVTRRIEAKKNSVCVSLRKPPEPSGSGKKNKHARWYFC
jgi:hypothetical protein